MRVAVPAVTKIAVNRRGHCPACSDPWEPGATLVLVVIDEADHEGDMVERKRWAHQHCTRRTEPVLWEGV